MLTNTGCMLMVCVLSTVRSAPTHAAGSPLSISVYATAGDVQTHLAAAEDRAQILPLLHRLNVSRVFLEGRRGDEYVPISTLAKVRDFFESRGIRVTGGIATVPGSRFGVRQEGGLDWLNWEAAKTRQDIADFFADNAKIFDEIIVDDFFCTGDTSAQAARGRAGRSWSAYRRDLLVSSIGPLMARPARRARQNVRLIVKFPQWYDRFHVFGYDPPRMAEHFDAVWVGTEVRNPRTRRMGFVQQTQGYMNFLWLKSIAGKKVLGAWFDHIECTDLQFVDQAYMSVLAGAPELTLFHLGDIVAEHPGDTLLAERLTELTSLAGALHGADPRGIFFYKPPGSDPGDNLFLMDYLGMLGLPIVPTSEYPGSSRTVFLAAHAAADPNVEVEVQRHLRKGGTLIMTPGFLRRAGSWAEALAGATSSGRAGLGKVNRGDRAIGATQVEIDAGLRTATGKALISTDAEGQSVPLLTRRRLAGGLVYVLNIRTFSDADYRVSGEWLLPPRQLGWSDAPQEVADQLRTPLMEPLGVKLLAPAGVVLCLRGKGQFLYNSNDEPVETRLGGKRHRLGAHQLLRP